MEVVNKEGITNLGLSNSKTPFCMLLLRTFSGLKKSNERIILHMITDNSMRSGVHTEGKPRSLTSLLTLKFICWLVDLLDGPYIYSYISMLLSEHLFIVCFFSTGQKFFAATPKNAFIFSIFKILKNYRIL